MWKRGGLKVGLVEGGEPSVNLTLTLHAPPPSLCGPSSLCFPHFLAPGCGPSLFVFVLSFRAGSCLHFFFISIFIFIYFFVKIVQVRRRQRQEGGEEDGRLVEAGGVFNFWYH